MNCITKTDSENVTTKYKKVSPQKDFQSKCIRPKCSKSSAEIMVTASESFLKIMQKRQSQA